MLNKKGKYRKAIFCVAYTKLDNKKIKYLLLKRKLHWKGWEFPKGKIEEYELLNKSGTALREVQEETGLKPAEKTLKKYPFKGKYPYKNKLKDRPGEIGQSYHLYSVEIPYSDKIKIDKKEHSSWKWCNFKQALKLLTWNNQKKALKIVNEKLRNPKNKF